jgi:hypothetical protein
MRARSLLFRVPSPSLSRRELTDRQPVKLLVPLFLLALLLVILIRPAFATGVEVRGQLNNWGGTPWIMSAAPGGFIYATGQISAASNAESRFKFFRDSDSWWSNGNGIIFNTIYTNLNGNPATPDMTFNHTQNRYYVFKWNGSDRGVVFQLSGPAATIPTVTRSPLFPLATESVTVTATTNVTPPAEQALWLRYTTNNWGSSTVVKMTGSETTYSATIPVQALGANISYYVFSSGNVDSIAGSDADLMTINLNNNGGPNYSYLVAAPITDARALWLDLEWRSGRLVPAALRAQRRPE